MKKAIKEKLELIVLLSLLVVSIYFFISEGLQERRYNENIDLRPCPFCGSTDCLEYERYYVGGQEIGTPDMTEVRCEKCHARVTIWYEGYSNIPDAKEVWNSRK